jgi:hypothetical protein
LLFSVCKSIGGKSKKINVNENSEDPIGRTPIFSKKHNPKAIPKKESAGRVLPAPWF